jgi:pSer/pThr/pTyr-binding forkhead associated (FHA) protein
MTEAHPLPATTIRIGRTPDNDIVLAKLDVSRHHAELRRNPDGSFVITDLNSHQGTRRRTASLRRRKSGQRPCYRQRA